MVRAAATSDRGGGLLGEARPLEPPPVQPAQPEWNIPTWEDIVRAHSARVYRRASPLPGHPHAPVVLTQEGFFRVFRSLSSYTPATFTAWLHPPPTHPPPPSPPPNLPIH